MEYARANAPDEVPHGSGEMSLRDWYRNDMQGVFAAHSDEIAGHILRKEKAPVLGPVRAVRLAKHIVGLLKEGSFLTRLWTGLDDIDQEVRAVLDAPLPDATDLAVRSYHELVRAAALNCRPRVVGLSIAFFSQIAPALLAAAWMRRYLPGVRICLGGQQVMLRHDALVRMKSVRGLADAVCWGPGEEPLAQWLAALDGQAPLDAVPGMTWLPSDAPVRQSPASFSLRFHDVGPPDFDGLPVRSYVNERAEFALISCVGCYWGRCVFCSYGNRSLPRGAYQQGTPRQIADHLEHVVRTTGTDFIAIVDENTNLRLIVRAMREVRRRGLKVAFSTRNRLESVLLDHGFCQELAELGCRSMAIGYEGTSQRLLDRMDRGVRAEDFQRIVDNVAEAGIDIRFSVMGGIFDETADEFESSLRFLQRNEARLGIDVMQLMVVEPGTRLDQDPHHYGLRVDRGARLSGNPEFNYLAGNVGYPYTVPGGASRDESLGRLDRLLHEVTPRTSALPPARKPPLHGMPPANRVRLRPWARLVPPRLAPTAAPAQSFVVADMVWEQLYAVPKGDVGWDEAGALTATSARGRAVLTRLVDAELAERCDPEQA
ncbi:MAG TPA: radical SAM protein [Amycolatopsis sp.]|uniref:B12-binding domain-containing radical SAM protein n=1 Tax=Amycolatopsis sp. TaxID=37632 RepID=UPI002B48E48B|nr:radical SAM protein [Amycolatopsis sp.]HKS46197.1 radical SAM protein [Amycolatopsis sp.]